MKFVEKISLLFLNPKKFFKILFGICRIKIKDAFFNKEGNRFTSNCETELLQKYAKNAKVGVVEIGILDGGTTKEMALVCSVPIYGIDPIIKDSMNKRLIGHENKIKRNLSFYKNFYFYKDFSYNIVKSWKSKFDFIFVDGDHSYNAVKQDFDDWFPLLNIGGFIAFHDSAPLVVDSVVVFEGWDGPMKLVEELKKDIRLEFIEVKDTINVFKKK